MADCVCVYEQTVNVAFTPTSVIRKMHSEKANEKEKQRRDSTDADAQGTPYTDTVLTIVRFMS